MPRRPTDSDDDFDLGFDAEDIKAFDEDDFDSQINPFDQADHDDDLRELDPGAFNVAAQTGPGILLHNGRKYAVGLKWLTTPDEAEPNLVYKRARTIRADFFCNRSFVQQSGFGFLSQGHRMGMPSAAAMAADTLVGEWHGMFSSENGWHCVAVHADTIAPDGDLFFESEEEAYTFFLTQVDKYQWPKTYAPEAWNIKTNDGEISLDRLLDDVPTTTLKPANLDGVFSGKKNKSIAFVGIVMFAALFILSLFAQALLPSLIPEQAQIGGPVVEVADILSAPPQEPLRKEDPLLQALENFTLPRPARVVDACMDGFSDLAVSLPGWNLSTMNCRNGMVEAVWQQESGSLESIKAYVDQFPFGVNRTYGARGDFLASRILSSTNDYDQRVSLAEREQVLLAVNERFGRIGRVEVVDIVPLADQIQQDGRGSRRLSSLNEQDSEEERPITIQDLPSLGVVFYTETAPLLIREYFNIPGLRFNRIEWNVYTRQWLYDMQIYLLPQDAPSRQQLGQS